MAKKGFPKTWLCKNCGWVLGFIYLEENKLHRLDLLAEAQDPESIPVVEPGVLPFSAWGRADVRCSHCGETRKWHPGQAALDKLIKRKLKTKERR